MSDPRGLDENVIQARFDGDTPHGGVYAVIFYLDDDLKPVPKKGATRFEIHEYDGGGQSIFHTTGSLTGTFDNN